MRATCRILIARYAMCIFERFGIPRIDLCESDLVSEVGRPRQFLREGIAVIPDIHKDAVPDERINDRTKVSITGK